MKLNIWRNFREKQVGKYVSAYLVFILLNYVLCLAPIGVSYCFSTQTVLLSSLLAYCFTLLAVTVFPFIYFPKESVGGTIMANLAIVTTILFLVAYMGLFILYNSVDKVTDILDANATNTVSIALIPAFIISLGLSIPVVRTHVAAEKPKQVINIIRKSEAEGDEVIAKINEEGIS
jgi:hypothetical protein